MSLYCTINDAREVVYKVKNRTCGAGLSRLSSDCKARLQSLVFSSCLNWMTLDLKVHIGIMVPACSQAHFYVYQPKVPLPTSLVWHCICSAEAIVTLALPDLYPPFPHHRWGDVYAVQRPLTDIDSSAATAPPKRRSSN